MHQMPRFDCTKVLPKWLTSSQTSCNWTAPPNGPCCECFKCKTWQQRWWNLVTNYCKLRFQNGNTPIFAKPKGVDWAVHHRFIIFVTGNCLSSLPSVSARTDFLVTNNANRSTLKFGDHATPNPPESRHATWSSSGHSARSNLTPTGRPPVGWGLRPKHFWIGTHSTENLKVRVFLETLVKKQKNISPFKLQYGRPPECSFQS